MASQFMIWLMFPFAALDLALDSSANSQGGIVSVLSIVTMSLICFGLPPVVLCWTAIRLLKRSPDASFIKCVSSAWTIRMRLLLVVHLLQGVLGAVALWPAKVLPDVWRRYLHLISVHWYVCLSGVTSLGRFAGGCCVESVCGMVVGVGSFVMEEWNIVLSFLWKSSTWLLMWACMMRALFMLIAWSLFHELLMRSLEAFGVPLMVCFIQWWVMSGMRPR